MHHRGREAADIGETAKLEAMIDRWQDLIFTVCYRMVGDYCEAQDLTQETFLAAWRAAICAST